MSDKKDIKDKIHLGMVCRERHLEYAIKRSKPLC